MLGVPQSIWTATRTGASGRQVRVEPAGLAAVYLYNALLKGSAAHALRSEEYEELWWSGRDR